MDRGEYDWVVTGPRRAMVIQRRIGGGWHKVADLRSEHKARELAEGLNNSTGTLNDVAALALELGSQDPLARLLIQRSVLRQEDFNGPDD